MSWRRELTLRGIVLGIAITIVFTAANVYFGLKSGQSFATSIPAAVISMALLRRFPGSSIQENNIVQTLASAAGTLSTVIFVLPGLIMIGWWSDFPYGVTAAICIFGGILGVMFSIPLRRALVVGSDLRYPEGTACAAVLAVGRGDTAASGAEANRRGLIAIITGFAISAGLTIAIATQCLAGTLKYFFRIGATSVATGLDFDLSLGLVGVGHLIGRWVGLGMLTGSLIAWAILVPYFASDNLPGGDPATAAIGLWTHKVRYVGAGAIAVGAIWTLIGLLKPITRGFRSALAASRVRRAAQGGDLPRTERDIPIGIVGAIALICMVPVTWLLADFASRSGLDAWQWPLAFGGAIYVVCMSAVVAGVCGYMAGLFGSSNSPLSGVGILVVIGAAILLAAIFKPLTPPSSQAALIAFALIVTAVIFAVAAIANDNLQDLKTGQLVDATPWCQQAALIIGVVAGGCIIPLILDLLNQAYGFAGAPNVDASRALPAPQAALISALAQGVLQGGVDWSLIGLGALIGCAAIAGDAALRRSSGGSLPPMAVGVGIYLPTSVILPAVFGSLLGWLYERRTAYAADPEDARRLGTLMASGLIVGESMIGVFVSAVVVASNAATPFALVGADFASVANWLGGLGFMGSAAMTYVWLARRSRPRESEAI